ncbi:MAG: hypothetical protein B7Z71_09395 [Acidocella sp. 21-58-7]|nr:MAG: hypothetical protein B7Z71_09395 [Acidocella sp. 21-58-7]
MRTQGGFSQQGCGQCGKRVTTRNHAVPFPLTRQELGEFLGLSTEHVSRLMAEFKRQGLLSEHKGTLHIPDSRRLLQHA